MIPSKEQRVSRSRGIDDIQRERRRAILASNAQSGNQPTLFAVTVRDNVPDPDQKTISMDKVGDAWCRIL